MYKLTSIVTILLCSVVFYCGRREEPSLLIWY